MKTPITPGEILLEEYLKPLGISQNAMARVIGVPPRAINEIVLGKRSITPAMSIRFLITDHCPLGTSSSPLPPPISNRQCLSSPRCRSARETEMLTSESDRYILGFGPPKVDVEALWAEYEAAKK